MNDTIISLLDACRQEPGFPFSDWTENPHSYFRLINFWDKVFDISSGDEAESYVSAQDLNQDSFSPIYFVKNGGGTKKIKIWYGFDDIGQPDVAFFWGRYPDLNRPDPDGRGYSASVEGVYALEISCDFEDQRVLAAAAMIRDFTQKKTESAVEQGILERSFEDKFRRYFPAPEIVFDDD